MLIVIQHLAAKAWESFIWKSLIQCHH